MASSKHWADCTRPYKLAGRDLPETDSQALVPGLDLKSPGKEYNPFSVMGRLAKRAPTPGTDNSTGHREGACHLGRSGWKERGCRVVWSGWVSEKMCSGEEKIPVS